MSVTCPGQGLCLQWNLHLPRCVVRGHTLGCYCHCGCTILVSSEVLTHTNEKRATSEPPVPVHGWFIALNPAGRGLSWFCRGTMKKSFVWGTCWSRLKYQAGSFSFRRLPGVLALHNLLLDRQAELASSLEHNEVLGESFFPASLPAFLITLALDLGTLNDKMIRSEIYFCRSKENYKTPHGLENFVSVNFE